MAMPPVEPALVAAMRQEFLSGSSTRDIAKKYSIASNTVQRYCKKQKWADDLKSVQMSASLPILVEAADNRAASIVRSYHGRLDSIVDSVSLALDRISSLIAGWDMSEESLQTIGGMQKILTDSLKNTQDLIQNAPRATFDDQPTIDVSVLGPDDAREFQRLLRMVTKTSLTKSTKGLKK